MRILVVEDDSTIASFVAKGLEEAGYAVDIAADGEEGLQMAETFPYDALIVDLMLPRRDGLSLIDAIRKQGSVCPVLILSAKRDLDDRIAGLQKGGDDYLTKPFSFAELLARIQALIRRSGMSPAAGRLSIDDLTLDVLAHEATRSGKRIELQPREYSLLEYMMRHAGAVLSKTMILEHVWDYHFDPQTNVVDVLIHRLRSKVDRGFEPKLIHTVHGVGYVLKVP